MSDRKIHCVYTITDQDVADLAEREAVKQETYANYECPFCRKFVWWDENHNHKEGENVRIKSKAPSDRSSS